MRPLRTLRPSPSCRHRTPTHVGAFAVPSSSQCPSSSQSPRAICPPCPLLRYLDASFCAFFHQWQTDSSGIDVILIGRVTCGVIFGIAVVVVLYVMSELVYHSFCDGREPHTWQDENLLTENTTATVPSFSAPRKRRNGKLRFAQQPSSAEACTYPSLSSAQTNSYVEESESVCAPTQRPPINRAASTSREVSFSEQGELSRPVQPPHINRPAGARPMLVSSTTRPRPASRQPSSESSSTVDVEHTKCGRHTALLFECTHATLYNICICTCICTYLYMCVYLSICAHVM